MRDQAKPHHYKHKGHWHHARHHELLPLAGHGGAPSPGGSMHGGSDVHAELKIVACHDPKGIYSHVVDAGVAKDNSSLLREGILGLLAGAYIGLGFALCMLCAGQIPLEFRTNYAGVFNFFYGAFGFPFGLSLCVLAGASLFTSNVLYMTASWIERKVSTLGWLRVVWMSYLFNLCGGLFLSWLMVWGDVFNHGKDAFVIELAHKKCSYTFSAALVRGILCNWLVCLAVWQANAAQDITGKVVGVWLPISAFVAMGYEHCVANMFAIPLSMHYNSGITSADFLRLNLVPVTIGNLIGGACFVAMMYGLSIGCWEAYLVRKYRAAFFTLRARLFPNSRPSHSNSSSHSSISINMGELTASAPKRPNTPPHRLSATTSSMDGVVTARIGAAMVGASHVAEAEEDLEAQKGMYI